MILYLDCFSGISGDMTVGALLDLGLPWDHLVRELSRLQLKGYDLRHGRSMDGALSGIGFQVLLSSTSPGSEAGFEIQSDPASDPSFTPGTPGAAPSSVEDTSGSNARSVPPHHHVTFRAIRKLIQGSGLHPGITLRALTIFQKLAEAEGKVHHQPADLVSFHEVGAIDSIVDIVGTAIGLQWLNVDHVVVSPLPMSRGFVDCQHGRLPLPAPATLELTRGLEVYDSGLAHELVTPTGAALVAALSGQTRGYPSMTVDRIGYGLGSRRGGAIPNALRAVLGRPATQASSGGEVASTLVLEASIDDMNPQFYGPLTDRLLEQGALDVVLIPVLMKKGRPGILLQVVCSGDRRENLTQTILRESTSIGIRYYPVERTYLDRRQVTVSTRFGDIRVKLSGTGGAVWNRMPEFEDCRQAAEAFGVPLKTVHQEAMAGAWSASFLDHSGEDPNHP